jgi:hypothetical protein
MRRCRMAKIKISPRSLCKLSDIHITQFYEYGYVYAILFDYYAPNICFILRGNLVKKYGF